MKVLLYSSVFWPSVGGVETITQTLANNIVQLGHECMVVTEALLNGKKELSTKYSIFRAPNMKKRLELARRSSLIHSNGASVKMYPYALIAGKPFIWTHNGYQVSCIDGLGWVDGESAPLTPISSVFFHFKRKGFFFILIQVMKLFYRRYVAYKADLNIACSNWVAKRQPLRNQIIAYTPYPLGSFVESQELISVLYDFIYIGRLVSEKGVDDLLRAFSILISEQSHKDKKLIIIGDGDKETDLKNLALDLNLGKNLIFVGTKRGSELTALINQSRIAVVPSIWEEPYGGVTLELLAAGKNLIVSERGGHAECAGKAALKFPNGDYISLYKCMKKLLDDDELARRQLENAKQQIVKFDERKLTNKYIEIYQSICNRYFSE